MSVASLMKAALSSTRSGRAHIESGRVKVEKESISSRWRQLTASCAMHVNPRLHTPMRTSIGSH